MKKRPPDVIFEAPPIASLERWQIAWGTMAYAFMATIVFRMVMGGGDGLVLFLGGIGAVCYLWWRHHNKEDLDKELLALLEKSDEAK